jgi:hypothetical protein
MDEVVWRQFDAVWTIQDHVLGQRRGIPFGVQLVPEPTNNLTSRARAQMTLIQKLLTMADYCAPVKGGSGPWFS